MNLSLPLDYLYPEKYGEFDDEQQRLVCDLNALDLVLIENASELFKDMIQDKNNIEFILKNITNQNSNIKYLDSQTFPFYVNDELKRIFYKDFPTSTDETRYNDLVKEYQKDINLNNIYVSIIAVDIEEFGGHYAAFHYEKGVVSLFDSMQGEIEKKEKPLYQKKYGSKISSSGGYTPYFMQLLSDIFPKAKEIYAPECIKNEVSVQFTGGFYGETPYSIVAQLEKDKKEKRNPLLNEDEIELLKIQSTDSQNHFCYLWAIFWIHLKIIGLELKTILPNFKTHDPLVSIKRYAWFLVHTLKLNKQIEYFPFFNKHFMSIWSNQPNKLSLNFNRYDIPHPIITNYINDAITESIKKVDLIQKSSTKIPKELCSKKHKK